MKSKGTAYLLWCCSLLFLCGLHRFYLGKWGTGLLWLFTFGLLGLGTLIDLFTLGSKVDVYNTQQELNTLVKDKFGRNREVLKVFVEHGAPEYILYENKPHIGTDILVEVVKNIREEIIKLGGEVLFNTKLIDFTIDDGKLNSILVENTISKETKIIKTDNIILAIGHSARDTFEKLYEERLRFK